MAQCHNALSDRPGHYSDIAKVTNVWRSPGTADKIRKAFIQLHGEARAKATVPRLPPRALRGRWGSITSVELFLLLAGPNFLPEAFAMVTRLEMIHIQLLLKCFTMLYMYYICHVFRK